MIKVNQKERNPYQSSDKGKELSKSFHMLVAQLDEDDDFLCGKVPNSSPEFKEEE
jgi:hypothetical protein